MGGITAVDEMLANVEEHMIDARHDRQKDSVVGAHGMARLKKEWTSAMRQWVNMLGGREIGYSSQSFDGLDQHLPMRD